MKTPRRVNKTKEVTEQQTASIPVSDAKALFDAVSKDNTKTIVLGKPQVVRQSPVKAGGETELTEQAATSQSLPDGVASALLNQEAPQTPLFKVFDSANPVVLSGELPDLPDRDLDLENTIDQAFEKAGLPVDTTTDQLVNQAVEQLNAEGIDFDALLEQGTAMMEQLMAGIDHTGPAIPGTIEMDIEQDDGSIKHHVFDNPDRTDHVVAMAQCDVLIQRYDQQKLEQATKPPVKPLRAKLFGFF